MDESDKNLPTAVPEVALPNPPEDTDYTPQEWADLQAFKAAGYPGIARIDLSATTRWLNLYLSGRTYTEIALQTKSDINLVLATAEKGMWFKKKSQMSEALAGSVYERVMENKLQSLHFLSDVMAFYHQTTGKKIKKYLETQDESVAKTIDLKGIEKYVKVLETVEKLVFKKPDDASAPQTVFNNFFGGAKIRRTGPNTVEINAEEPEDDLSILELEARRLKSEIDE